MGAAVGATGNATGPSRPNQARKRRPLGDTQWLELRGRSWYCVQDVPRPLRAVMGRKRMVRSLETHDQHVAVVRRHAVLAEWQREFAKVRSKSYADPLITAAMGWRDIVAQVEREVEYADDGSPMDGGAYDATVSALAAEAERIEAEQGYATRKRSIRWQAEMPHHSCITWMRGLLKVVAKVR